MSNDWYYAKDGQSVGPVSADELKKLAAEGRIVHGDKIWKDGLAEWVAAGTLKGLFANPPLLAKDAASQSPEPQQQRRREYKVLTQKDKWFTKKFDPALLEEALNSYSQLGWVLKAAATATFPGFGGSREELIMILER